MICDFESQISAFRNHVTIDKLFPLPKPQFPHLYSGGMLVSICEFAAPNNRTNISTVLEESNYAEDVSSY